MFGKKKTVEREVVEMTTKDKAKKYKYELANGYAVDADCNVKKDKFGNAKKLNYNEVVYRQGFLGAMGETYEMSKNLKKKPRISVKKNSSSNYQGNNQNGNSGNYNKGGNNGGYSNRYNVNYNNNNNYHK